MSKQTFPQTQSKSHNLPWPIAWRVSFKRGSWWLAVVSALVIGAGFGMGLQGKTAVSWPPLRIIEVALPLCFALQAGFVLPPDHEPALEILSSTQRRLPLIALERLLAAFLLQSGVALAATLMGIALFDAGSVQEEIIRWLPPALFLGGVIFFAVQTTRQGVSGALLAIMLWAGLFFGGDAAVFRWPSLQPIHAFLRPDLVSTAGYAQNRVTLTAVGLLCTGFGLWLLRDEARVLGWRPQPDWHYWAQRLAILAWGLRKWEG